jgi:DNA-binding LacI/PurR family transcriptional regulator
VTACERAGVPVILFNRFQDDPRVSSVSVDNVGGGAKAAEFLVSGGHRRIAYIAGVEDTAAQRGREAGFRQQLTALGMPLFDRAVGEFETEPARRAARLLFGRPAADRPDAVFACSDQMAIAVMDVLRFELGLRIPEDVSVVGFDDVPQAAWPTYDLTTLHVPIGGMIDAMTQALFERIERPHAAPRPVQMPVSLVVRGSARVPEGWAS